MARNFQRLDPEHRLFARTFLHILRSSIGNFFRASIFEVRNLLLTQSDLYCLRGPHTVISAGWELTFRVMIHVSAKAAPGKNYSQRLVIGNFVATVSELISAKWRIDFALQAIRRSSDFFPGLASFGEAVMGQHEFLNLSLMFDAGGVSPGNTSKNGETVRCGNRF